MLMNTKTWIKSFAKGIGYFFAFVAPTLAVAYLTLMNGQAALIAPAKQPFAGSPLPPPAHDPSKPTVAIVASNNGTEITDFLAPYEVFAASGAFNVYAVAPKRAYTPFMWGGVDILPHYSFTELDQLLGKNPDVIVIPFIKDPENPEIVQWIREHAGSNTQVVSICGGALVLAATGLVDAGKVTTHQGVFPVLEKQYPHIQTVRGVRYTDNGNTITSAGITAGIDASLYTVQKLLGKEVALVTAQKLNYPHIRFLDDPAYQVPNRDAAGLAMNANAGLLWQKSEFGVYLYEGVDEIDLTAVLDTYGRTFTARTVTFAQQRGIIHSRHGLSLVPRLDLDEVRGVNRILVPGRQADLPNVEALTTWAQAQHGLSVEYLYPMGTTAVFAFDVTLPDLARWSSSIDAHSSATTLEYPAEHLDLGGRSWPLSRLFSVLVVGLVGVGVVFAIEKGWSARTKRFRFATV
jgi:transcriptional regulator GlxA family with amidase domain